MGGPPIDARIHNGQLSDSPRWLKGVLAPMRGQIVTSPPMYAGDRVKYVRPLHWPHWTEDDVQHHNPNGDIMTIGLQNCFGCVGIFIGRIDEEGVLWEVDYETKEWRVY